MDLVCCVELVGGSTCVCRLFCLVGIPSTMFVLFMFFLHIQGSPSALDINESILVTVKRDTLCVQ